MQPAKAELNGQYPGENKDGQHQGAIASPHCHQF